jgi:hypothetical protein
MLQSNRIECRMPNAKAFRSGIPHSTFSIPHSPFPLPSRSASRHAQRSWPALALPPPALLRRLLVIGHTLDVLREALLFAHLLETAQHLFRRLVATTLHLNHSNLGSGLQRPPGQSKQKPQAGLPCPWSHKCTEGQDLFKLTGGTAIPMGARTICRLNPSHTRSRRRVSLQRHGIVPHRVRLAEASLAVTALPCPENGPPSRRLPAHLKKRCTVMHLLHQNR